MVLRHFFFLGRRNFFSTICSLCLHQYGTYRVWNLSDNKSPLIYCCYYLCTNWIPLLPYCLMYVYALHTTCPSLNSRGTLEAVLLFRRRLLWSSKEPPTIDRSSIWETYYRLLTYFVSLVLIIISEIALELICKKTFF
jgi:hypothetical protein